MKIYIYIIAGRKSSQISCGVRGKTPPHLHTVLPKYWPRKTTRGNLIVVENSEEEEPHQDAGDPQERRQTQRERAGRGRQGRLTVSSVT